jgi:hypothetical protein
MKMTQTMQYRAIKMQTDMETRDASKKLLMVVNDVKTIASPTNKPVDAKIVAHGIHQIKLVNHKDEADHPEDVRRIDHGPLAAWVFLLAKGLLRVRG